MIEGEVTELVRIPWLQVTGAIKATMLLDVGMPEPTARQRAQLEAFQRLDARAAAEEALFLYYGGIRGLTDYGSEEAQQEAEPPLSSPSEVWSVVSNPTVFVSWDDGRGEAAPKVFVNWDATFDDHGVSVEFTEGALTGVGTFLACERIAVVRARFGER